MIAKTEMINGTQDRSKQRPERAELFFPFWGPLLDAPSPLLCCEFEVAVPVGMAMADSGVKEANSSHVAVATLAGMDSGVKEGAEMDEGSGTVVTPTGRVTLARASYHCVSHL